MCCTRLEGLCFTHLALGVSSERKKGFDLLTLIFDIGAWLGHVFYDS